MKEVHQNVITLKKVLIFICIPIQTHTIPNSLQIQIITSTTQPLKPIPQQMPTPLKRQHPSQHQQIDLSTQPYDRYLQNLKYWKIKDHQTIVKTLKYFLNYKYQCLAEMSYISEKVIVFHKDICKVNDKGEEDQEKVELRAEYFEKVLELKARFKKLEKKGCFQGEKRMRIRFEEIQRQKKNLVNVNLVIPSQLLSSENQQYHKHQLTSLYRSFVAYYPQSHTSPTLNSQLISFLKQLYKQMKKRSFFLKQREYFSFEIEKLCEKLRNPKFLENKKLMLSGEISIKEIVMNRISVFQNYSVKKREQEDMMKILRESQIERQNQLTEENKENGENTKNQENGQVNEGYPIDNYENQLRQHNENPQGEKNPKDFSFQ